MSLREQLREGLPSDVIDLWDEIERYADLTIDVRAQPIIDRPRRAAVLVTHKGASLFLATDGSLDPAAAFHELQHISRTWLEQTPRLVGRGASERIATMLENDIEHLHVVPRQIAAGRNDPFVLEADLEQQWRSYPWPNSSLPWQRRYANFIGASMKRYVRPEVAELIDSGLTREGANQEAGRFVDRMESFRTDKPRAVSCALRFIGLQGDFALMHVDIRKRTYKIEQVPPY